MSNEIRSITSVKGLFGRECVSLYHESDLMKPVGEDVYGDTLYSIEEFEVQSKGRYAVGLCINSYPFFCRYDLCEYFDGTPRQTWLAILNNHNSVHDEMKNVAKYEGICPKCGWGVSAYLAIRCKYDERFGVCYYDRRGNETNQRTTFKAYIDICHTIYKAIHQDEYRHYTAIGDVEAVNRLEADFISQHRKAEEHSRNISGEVDRLFFAGQLAKVVGEYLDYVSVVEAGGHKEGQQADKWVIDADVTLRVFGGDRAKAVDYLNKVIGKGYCVSRYGQVTGKMLKKQRGQGKLLWLLICANDKTQTPKSVKTFNKNW